MSAVGGCALKSVIVAWHAFCLLHYVDRTENYCAQGGPDLCSAGTMSLEHCAQGGWVGCLREGA